jgi:hypothetical protein
LSSGVVLGQPVDQLGKKGGDLQVFKSLKHWLGLGLGAALVCNAPAQAPVEGAPPKLPNIVILLMLALTRTEDTKDIQRMFSIYQ